MKPAVRYRSVPPPENLRPYIRSFWIFEMDLLPGRSYVYRSLADGCPEMVLHYKGLFDELVSGQHIPQPRLMLHAQSQQYTRFITHQSFGILGVYIYPFAVKSLFGHAAIGLSNLMPALGDLIGHNGLLLEEQLMLAATNQKRIALLSSYFTEQLATRPPAPDILNDAVRRIIHQNPYANVQQLSAEVGLSQRQLERRFKEQVGFSPKKFLRIMRFHQALKHYGSSEHSLTSLAYNCGYYDQSHFIHDFKAFSGFHPKQYFSGGAEGTEYL